ncbi:MAG TPA: IlvD/Edd family dehydratase [Acidimicrobiales bacterium]|nr:IlvD/Edd family dehydratase [Acidimicrobiales bacterium]
MAEGGEPGSTEPEGGEPLRSAAWFAATGRLGFVHRSHTKSEGFPDDLFDGRPVIGILTSWSELAPCNAHLHDLAWSVKAGVYEAGGFPLEMPVLALGETLLRPTSMLYRNLAALEVEELLRANPIDGAVLLAGCDKTTPAVLMGAASTGLPAILVTGGPMVNGRFRGEIAGSGTDVWRFAEEVRAGRMAASELVAAESCVSRGAGHCTTMGTASTMAAITEAMGLQLSGTSLVPAVDGARKVAAQQAGRRAVALVREGFGLSRLLTREAFENGLRANAALGGSTNAVVHLLALAGRAGVELCLDDVDRLGADVPLLANCRPNGEHLMEDLWAAGGVPALLAEIRDLLHLDAITVSGRSLGEEIAAARCDDRRVIRTRAEPVRPPGSATAVLRGNLCPDGAVIKVSAASPALLTHRGRALVFDSIEDYLAAADRDDLEVDASNVLVLRNAGPCGYPGMPELGNLPLPKPVLRAGVSDMVRITDARMSGTAFGTVVLHVAPESYVGGPLAALRDGDVVALDVARRRLDVELGEGELDSRLAQWRAARRPDADLRAGGGYAALYREHVLQADRGADFDFLVGSRGHGVPRPPF